LLDRLYKVNRILRPRQRYRRQCVWRPVSWRSCSSRAASTGKPDEHSNSIWLWWLWWLQCAGCVRYM